MHIFLFLSVVNLALHIFIECYTATMGIQIGESLMENKGSTYKVSYHTNNSCADAILKILVLIMNKIIY